MKKPMEKILILFISVCAVILVGVNLLRDNITLDVMNDRQAANGVYYKDSSIYREPMFITFGFTGCDHTVLLLNGERVDTAKTSNGYSTAQVFEGDVISADMREVEQEAVINIIDASEEISYPLVGTKVFIFGGIKTLFKVECK